MLDPYNKKDYQQQYSLLEPQCITVHSRQLVNHHINQYVIEITRPLLLLLFDVQFTMLHMLLQSITVDPTQLVNQQ